MTVAPLDGGGKTLLRSPRFRFIWYTSILLHLEHFATLLKTLWEMKMEKTREALYLPMLDTLLYTLKHFVKLNIYLTLMCYKRV